MEFKEDESILMQCGFPRHSRFFIANKQHGIRVVVVLVCLRHLNS